VPHEGVTPGGSGDAAYSDRRFRDVDLVDYSQPGFAVVYTDGPVPAGGAELTIRSGAARSRLDPPQAALGSGGTIVVRNATSEPHVVSFPAAGYVASLAPGEKAELAVPEPGELQLFLLDEPGVEARLFASPGPFSVAARTGGFALYDLAPGRHELRVWHPRFPTASRWVELPADGVVEVELAVGVQIGREGEDR